MDELIILAIIWIGVFISSYMAKRTRLTSVLYFLAFGAISVNIGLLPKEMPPFIKIFGELGIIIIMFALGFEEDIGNFIKGIKRSWGIALFGALAPFLATYFTILYFSGDGKMALICALAMASTAVSLTMLSLKSENLHKTKVAIGIMSSAIIDHVSSLALVAVVVPIAVGAAAVTLAGVTGVVAKAIGFFVIVTLLGLAIFPRSEREGMLGNSPIVKYINIRRLLVLSGREHMTLAILLIALIIGILAHELGFHAAVGAYMAGLILKKEHFNLYSKKKINHYENVKKIIDDAAFSWIGPVFFVILGTHLVFDFDIFISVIPETIVLTGAIMIAQVTAACLAARYTGKFEWHESIMIGTGMLGRAELTFIVLNIGYIQYDIISTEAFYTLMFTAFWLNVSVPLSIRFWKPYFMGEKHLSVLGIQLSAGAAEKDRRA